MASSPVFFGLTCLLACLPPAAVSLPEECAERAGACPDDARHMSLLQRQHEVRLPEAAESAGGGAGPVQQRPNIVLFLPDDMYLNDYMPWGDSDFGPPVPSNVNVRAETINNVGVMPHFDKIAQSGAIFTRAYTSSSLCTPARYSIMTGRYPSRSQFAKDYWSQYFPTISEGFVKETSLLGNGYSDTKNTVASALRRFGYTTGMVGKWHLAKESEAGFQSPYLQQTQFVKQSGFDFVDGLYINNMCDCEWDVCLTFTHNMEWMLDRALHFMDGAMLKQQPFFLYFAPTVPHRPSVADALLGRSGAGEPDSTPSGRLANLPDISRYCSSCVLPSRKHIWDSVAGLMSKARVRSCQGSLAALRWVDEALGVLYDFLSERSALGNTYIVLSTDHGSVKYTLYELGIRVPLYVVGPGIRAGTLVDEPVSHVDLAPTFLRWAGCSGSVDSCMGISVDGLSWSSLASTGAGSLDREGVRAESYFDRALVKRDFMKLYTMPTTAIIEERTGTAISTETDTSLNSTDLDLTQMVHNLAIFTGSAYPALYDEYQLYNLSMDPMEQVNLWHQ